MSDVSHSGRILPVCGSPVGIWPRCDWLIAWNADIAGPGRKNGTVSARRATVRSHLDAIQLHDGIARACARAGHPFVASSRAFIMWTQIWTPRFRHHTINRTILQSYQCIDKKKRSAMGIIYTDEKRFTERRWSICSCPSAGCPANIPIGRIGP